MPAEPAPAALSGLARQLVRTTFGVHATEPQPLAAGAWSQAFELTIDGVEVVLRIGAHGTDFAKGSRSCPAGGGGLLPGSASAPVLLDLTVLYAMVPCLWNCSTGGQE
ncbi:MULTISPECIES: hypothetical protein [unclassified Streptomyces]|uniref:hypothetical protein n=1 Tax=unclassified Streptomyces TaxID=2593676 RepID=UPI002DDB0B5F|nr:MULTISPECIES: hypothetical protein [unclassified Streptomyces]WSF81794.1 hypothetical protein OIE70_00400 [Streptomyces sp. NBC_01744]WSC34162.1 hypothetical protein OHA08_00395 [Streptomyces sp. NBC_01763]WSC41896.1 hypothetical protein OHA08_44585 [Streptomyces sp. NBC_01763]WSC42590.1 hypothetical protein OIE61_00305 [Streptomyces sp. NBC_01762]WSC50263.1 hypothetical protein OIE61_44170 [Streptomyces sp. NBC_01762]